MNKVKGNQFYTNDKDIRDQLFQRTPGLTSILNHLKQRGLLFSPAENKLDLVQDICPWFTSFFDKNFIIDELGGGNTHKRHNYSEVIIPFEKNELREVLRDLRKEFDINIIQINNSFTISENYTKADFTKNALSQHVQKIAEIKIERTAEGNILVRTNSDEQATKIANSLKSKLKAKNSEVYEEFEIDLSNITDPTIRSNFFINIARGIKGYKLVDMRSANINMLDSPIEVNGEVDEITVGKIKKMALNGGSVHEAPELISLLQKGFYFTKVEWTIEKKNSSNDKIDLYAEFQDYNECTGFRYGIQRVYSKKSDGTFSSNGKPPNEQQRQMILPLVEDSAKKTFNKILEDFAKPQPKKKAKVKNDDNQMV